jgi:hypothetical protein
MTCKNIRANIQHAYMLVLTIMCAVVTGCNLSGPEPATEQVAVYVFDVNGRPVSGVTVRGGALDYAFKLVTDKNGMVQVPANTRGEPASFFCTGFIPLFANDLGQSTYVLKRSSRYLSWVGRIEGTVVDWKPGKIVAVSDDGVYRLYQYTDQSVSIVSSLHLHDSLLHVGAYALQGDTLWLGSTDGVLYAFSVQSPGIPQPLLRLPVSGRITGVAAQDSMIAVASTGPDRLRIYVRSAIEGCRQVFDAAWTTSQIGFAGHALLALGEHLPTVVDCSNPISPKTAFQSGATSASWHGFLFDNDIILSPNAYWSGKLLNHLYSFNGAAVLDKGEFPSDLPLNAWVCDSIAVGRYEQGGMAILTGSAGNGFTIASVVAGEGLTLQGAFHPWYVIGSTLWKMH